ncbi:MAG: GNAT family N-acetyltransferase [Pyrinomonadaceae bacterium]
MGGHSITFEEHAKDEDVRRISEGLGKYNLEQTGRNDFRKLNIFVRDGDGEIIGGVIGGTYWGWLYVDLLWIDERARHLGYGRKLLVAAEEEAIKRGCTQVFLDTFSFQARPFYEKHGYTVFGKLKDFPPGHERYFLQKTLSEDLSRHASV